MITVEQLSGPGYYRLELEGSDFSREEAYRQRLTIATDFRWKQRIRYGSPAGNMFQLIRVNNGYLSSTDLYQSFGFKLVQGIGNCLPVKPKPVG